MLRDPRPVCRNAWGLLWLGAGCCLALSIGCTSGNGSGVSPSARQSVSIGVPNEPLGVLVVIAQQQGFFAEAGLDVDMAKTYPSGKRALAGMLEGEVDLTISSEVPLVFRAFEQDDFRILATIGTSDNEPQIIVRRDKGIENPADLGGKKIATQKASAVHYFLHLFLSKHGIDDAEVTYLKAEDLPPALADGTIDAFSMREPFIGRARELIGDEAQVFSEPGMYRKTMNLVALDELVEQRPAAVERVLRAIIQAETFFRENRAAAVAIAAEQLSTDPQALGALLDEVELQVALSQALVVALEDEARWAIDNGFVAQQQVPDFEKLIAADALRAIEPAVVTVMQ